MNSRESVIPPRNNKPLGADLSPEILVESPILGAELIEKAGFAEWATSGNGAEKCGRNRGTTT
jgi:hypothetical protein